MFNTTTPSYLSAYRGMNNNQISKQKEEKEQSSDNGEQQKRQERAPKQEPQTTPQRIVENSEGEQIQIHTYEPTYPQVRQIQQIKPPQPNTFPNGQKSAVDYSKGEINIAQILVDFKNTTNAIGAKKDVMEEVFTYLALIEHQAKKENPDVYIIKSNLKNAAKILDVYITETLKKQSNVVESWIDALFLQKINFKFEEPIQEEPEKAAAQAQPTEPQKEEQKQETPKPEEKKEEIINKNGVYIPQDKELKKMFIRSKKFASIENINKALELFNSTLQYAKEVGDVQTQALVHFETGRIFDKSNDVVGALDNYQQAAVLSKDNNIKARAHISMAQIYDDFVKFEPAVDHYCAAVSFAGEADNLNLQTKALADLADIHSERYDKKNSFMFMDLADSVSRETKNKKFIGSTLSRCAKISTRLDESAKALSYYRESTRYYEQANAVENEIKNYQAAAQIMVKLGNKTKAKALLTRAYSKLSKIDSNATEITSDLNAQILALAN